MQVSFVVPDHLHDEAKKWLPRHCILACQVIEDCIIETHVSYAGDRDYFLTQRPFTFIINLFGGIEEADQYLQSYQEDANDHDDIDWYESLISYYDRKVNNRKIVSIIDDIEEAAFADMTGDANDSQEHLLNLIGQAYPQVKGAIDVSRVVYVAAANNVLDIIRKSESQPESLK